MDGKTRVTEWDSMMPLPVAGFLAGTLRAARLVGEEPLGFNDAGSPGLDVGIGFRVSIDFADCAEESTQGPLGLLVGAAADCAHGGLQRAGFLVIGGIAGGKQPVEFVFGYRLGEPAEEQEGGFRQGDLAERDAEGELEERGTCPAGPDLEKGSFDCTAAGRCVLGDDEEARAGVGGKLLAAPESAGGKLGLGVGGLEKMDGFGGGAGDGLTPLAPGIEEGALDGQDSVEAGEQQGRALGVVGRGRLGLEQSGQLHGEPRGA